MPGDLPNDLDLTAFRYVSGDMQPDEAAAFERQLGEDQSAREATARAVAIGQRLAAYGHHEQHVLPTRPRWRQVARNVYRPIGWMTLGAAAASILFLLAWPTAATPVVKRPAERPDVPQAAAPDALVWAKIQATGHWTRSLVPPEAPVAPASEWDMGRTNLPSWLMVTDLPPQGEKP